MTDYSPVAATEEERERLILTAEDVKNLRRAEVVSFHWHEGESYIHASSRDWHDERSRSRWNARIDCLSRLTAYREDGHGMDHQYRFDRAYASILSARFHPEWVTIADLIRAGDVLELSWTANNANGYVRDAGLVRDELHLVVYRKNNRVKRLTFLIESTVGKDNTARMVQRGPSNSLAPVRAGV